MAFQHLVAGTVSSAEVILVKDNLTLSSLALSQHLLSSWAQSSAIPRICILVLEQSPTRFHSLGKQSPNPDKFTILDIVSDSRGWKSKSAGAKDLASLKSQLRSSIPAKTTSVLYIDSIASLLAHGHSATQIATFLAELHEFFSSVVCILHTDIVVDATAISILESVATCVIDTLPLPKHPLIDVNGSFSMLQKRKTGKVSRITEHYTYKAENADSLTFCTDAQVIRKEAAAQPEQKLKLKMDVLTPEQEAARAQVSLPYTKAQEYASQSVSGLPERSLDEPVPGAVYVDPEDIDPDDDADLDDF